MKKITLLVLMLTLGCVAFANDLTKDFITGTPSIKSMSQLAFAPQGILLIGDTKAASVFAVATDDKTPGTAPKRLQINNIEAKLAALLGTKKEEVMIHDMVVNPISKNIYLAVSRGQRRGTTPWKLPADLADATLLIRVKSGKDLEEVPLKNVKYSQVAVPNPTPLKTKYWRGDARVDVITDIAYANGTVYIAGLSNEEFISTFRKVPFPFKSDQLTASTLEIYHGAHGKYETKAPIRAFMPYALNGKPHILASYTCTPLVTIPEAKLKNGQHVKGRTVAELGMRNMPLDMIAIKQKDKEYILMANSTRNLMKISVNALAKTQHNITTRLKDRGGSEGVKFTSAPFLVQHLDKLNEKQVAVVMRMMDGSLALGTLPVRIL
ncbi:hypothetical protein BKI52_08920 [marine bacterium AO1-C]|nr:hypothetical protein BKI52_08920 [marine bacterium AO1-C]